MASASLDESQPTPEFTGGNRPPQPVSMLGLFQEALPLLSRYFIIVNPVFLFSCLSYFMPSAPPKFHPVAWWSVTTGLVAILFLFQAGWNWMMYKSVEMWEFEKHPVSPPPEDLVEGPFYWIKLLNAFMQGLGEFGLPFLIGGILWSLVTLLHVWLFLICQSQVPGFHHYTELIQQFSTDPTQGQNLLMNLPEAEMEQIAGCILLIIGGFLVSSVINYLLQFWQPYLLIKRCNPFKAMVYSVRHVLRHPVQSFMIWGGFILLSFFCLSFTLLPALVSMFSLLLMVIGIVYFGLLQYLYLAEGDVVA